MRQTLRGTGSRPRLVVFRSHKYFYAQIIDDQKGYTIASVNKTTDPAAAGRELAEKAKKAKIDKVVFDRAGYKYHGQVKAFAEAVREGGVNF